MSSVSPGGDPIVDATLAPYFENIPAEYAGGGGGIDLHGEGEGGIKEAGEASFARDAMDIE